MYVKQQQNVKKGACNDHVILPLIFSKFKIAVQRSPSICMEKMPETFEMDRVLEKRKVSENTEVKQEKCFENHPDDECSEKPPVKSQ